MSNSFVEVNTISDKEVARLRSLGWYSLPHDGRERLYPPGDYIDLEGVSFREIARLKSLGWYALADDKAERLYRPLDASSSAEASLVGLDGLKIAGKAVPADVARVLLDARIERSLDGVNVLSLDVHDDALKLLRSNVFYGRVPATIGAWTFEMVQIRKSGSTMGIVFEDISIAQLRRKNNPFKVAPGTTSHVAFVRRMVREVPGLTFFTPMIATDRNLRELARGNPAENQREDSWSTIKRTGDERGWRVFVKNPRQIYYAPETWMIKQPIQYRITEGADGVDTIDFDYDAGKPVATCKVRARASRWDLPVGLVVEVYRMGAISGRWIISSVNRSLFSLDVDLTLTRAAPTLPEPRAEDRGGAGGAPSTYTGARKTYRGLGAVKPHVRDAAEEVGGKFSVTTVYGVGQRDRKSDHPLGLALDFMTYRDKRKGDGIADYMIDNASRMKVKYLIWQQRIWYPRRGWVRMSDRGSITANHYDHVHASFNR